MNKDWTYVIVIFAIILLAFLFTRGNMTGKTTTSTEDPQKNVAVLETSMGTIKIELYDDMPITTTNFENLINEGFYDGTLFHRVIDGFMIQGGDPLTKDETKQDLWGTGGSEPIQDEFTHAGGNKNLAYTISMANAGPNTGSSQFFINLVDNNYLNTKHPAFGKVIEGKDVVAAIGKVPTDENDRPIEQVKIIKAYME